MKYQVLNKINPPPKYEELKNGGTYKYIIVICT